MAMIKVLRECVVAHRRRIPGESLAVDENTARQMAAEAPETFEWVDRPVQQFVDVTPQAPVAADGLTLLTPRKRRKTEVSDGNESAG